uniref:C1q domain-containing protein n=1 Tax=Pundamilia nyererei TaxID=303518 RepID=A0A3B4F747_9CICH
MEIMVFFSLLLLACSVSTNPTEADNEIVDQQISNQQPCQQDIHAVLREMAVSLAEQKIEIRTLKQDNQGTVVNPQLKEKCLNQKQKFKTIHLPSLSVKQVAFSASLLEGGYGYTGPFNVQITLVFRRVITNIGNAYNPQTGIFIAPVRGAYHFEWHLHGHAYKSHPIAGVLFRNGEHIFLAFELQASGTVSTSCGTSLLLEPGDQVSLRLWAHARIFDGVNHDTNFSGHLLFTV